MSTALSIKDRFRLSRFIKGEKPGPDTITLNHRRIFILPSKQGLGFVLLISLLLLVAIVYNNNLAYILTFLLAGIFFVSILHSFKSMAGIILRPGKTTNAFAGETAGFELHLENPIAVDRVNLQLSTDASPTIHVDIPAFSTTHVTLFSITRKRGRHRLGTITVSSYFPLGLFRCWSPINFDVYALVYPKPSAANRPYPEQGSSSTDLGHIKSGNDDFYALNNYQTGDPIRRIHWQAYAKGHGLFIKQYSGAIAAEIWLDYEHTPGNTTEQRLSRLCRWVLEAEQSGIRYGFNIPGTKLAPSKGSIHYKQCLEALALFGG